MTLGTRPRQRLTLAVACMAQGMMVLDVLIVSVALPAMQRELHLSPAGLEWIVSGYALALAALIPTGGALGDHFGRKRIFMSGVTLFTLASVGCALSVAGAMLVGFRVIQGIGGAVMSSLTLSLISEAYPPEARTGPIGLWAAISGLAVAGGSVLGGLLLSVFPWSSIFWVNVPIGVVTVVICLAAVRESREPVPRSFDIPGVALSASGLLLLTFGFVESSDIGWHSPVAAACVAGGTVILAVFVAWERRAAAPMVPPALLRTRGFGWACAVYLLAYLAFSGFIYYVTLFFQNIEQWSALRTGLSWLFFCLPYFVVGVGFGLMVPAGSSAAMAEVPPGSSGIGSALFNSCRQIGTAMGLAILGSVAASVILAEWHRRAGTLPPAGRQAASRLAADVAGGQAHLVAASAGQDLLDPAIASFLSGFEAALLLAGVILASAGVVGIRGLRHLQMLGS